MGKLAWMIVIGVMYKMVDPISAIILAVIMITLLHQNTIEGYSNKKSEEEKTDQEKIAEMEKEMDEKEKKEKNEKQRRIWKIKKKWKIKKEWKMIKN